MKKLHFEVAIRAPRQHVWRTMLALDTYRLWTAPFAEGSTYEGSWDEGAQIRFLGPEGGGMVAEIAENRPYERLSIRHLGMISGGAGDTQTPEVTAWGPAYEDYTLSEEDGVTTVRVDMDSAPEYEEMFSGMWPAALAKLKELCER